MKSYTTKVFKSFALFYMAFPVAYVVFAAIIFDIPAQSCVRLLLSPFYYIVGILAVVAGYGLWEMKRWSWYLFIATNILVAYGNALLANDYSQSHHKFLAFLASIATLLIVSYRLSREIRVPYFFPKIRWWESNPRYRLAVSSQLRTKVGEPVTGQILDLSMGGCFVKLRADVQRDDVVFLKFSVFGFELECNGIIVWCTESTVTHPRGIGVKFGSLPRIQKKKLRQVCARLKKIASLYRRSRYLLNQDDFLKRLEELEKKSSAPKRSLA